MGTYSETEHSYIFHDEQRSDTWLQRRKGIISSSDFYKACGYATYDRLSGYENMMALAVEKNTGVRREFTEGQRFQMDQGTYYEPRIRKIYEECNRCTVTELGLAVPKSDTRIGGSTDGKPDIPKRLVEFKCPKFMYVNLWRAKQGHCNPTDVIKDDHKFQMCGAMFSLAQDSCDYGVLSWGTGDYIQLHYPYDRELWEGTVYPGLQRFLHIANYARGPFLQGDRRIEFEMPE